jgi:putative transposase
MIDKQDNRRRSVRLKEYDYSQTGAYFVTICTQNRECLLGEITDGEMKLNNAGRIVQLAWDKLPRRYLETELDAYVIMPNHLHGIVILHSESVGARSSRPDESKTVGAGSSCPNKGRENRAPTLGTIVAYFKYQTTTQINAIRNVGIQKFWQRNYYEHVIRNEADLAEVREYILNNPARWNEDDYNPALLNSDN